MPTRLALCTSLTIAVLAVPASAQAAHTVVPSSVARSTTVPAGGSSTLTLRCPTAAVALNAAVTRRGAGVTVRRSIPGAGADDWSFRLSAGGGGAGRRGVRAVLRCVRLDLRDGVFGARLDVSTRRPPAIRVPAGGSTSTALRCAPGFVPSGYGLDRGARGNLTLAAAMPTARGWEFRVENTGRSAGSARLSARCLKRDVSARRGGGGTQLRFGLARRAFSDAVGRMPGSRGTFTHTCAESKFSVATGHTVDPDGGILVTGGGPNGLRAGRWSFRGAAARDVMTTYVLCLNRRTQFH